jgi:hypothetical protein
LNLLKIAGLGPTGGGVNSESKTVGKHKNYHGVFRKRKAGTRPLLEKNISLQFCKRRLFHFKSPRIVTRFMRVVIPNATPVENLFQNNDRHKFNKDLRA